MAAQPLGAMTRDDLKALMKEVVRDVVRPISEKVDILVRTNPEAALLELQPPVIGIGTKAAHEVIIHGARATWTLMKRSTDEETTYLAVSCAHCAFAYEKCSLPESQFVDIPPQLCSLVTEVGYLADWHSGAAIADRKTKLDLAVLKLRELPEGTNADVLPEWAVLDRNQQWRGKVGGLTLSGNTLRGTGWSWDDGVIVFLMDSGEPGNSGTLMYYILERPILLGVFHGIDTSGRTQPPMTLRGQIVPLPSYDEISWDKVKQLADVFKSGALVFEMKHFLASSKAVLRFAAEYGSKTCFVSKEGGEVVDRAHGVFIPRIQQRRQGWFGGYKFRKDAPASESMN